MCFLSYRILPSLMMDVRKVSLCTKRLRMVERDCTRMSKGNDRGIRRLIMRACSTGSPDLSVITSKSTSLSRVAVPFAWDPNKMIRRGSNSLARFSAYCLIPVLIFAMFLHYMFFQAMSSSLLFYATQTDSLWPVLKFRVELKERNKISLTKPQSH